jgi:predicted ATPase
MLTRLRVSGFKNLLDLDLHFGPFTCVAGVNGAGKSNLFDAVGFLGALADRPLADAAESVRARDRRATDVDDLFLRAGADSVAEMSFAAEMIVPGEAVDDLGQTARPSITFLHYHLVVARRQDAASRHLGPLEIVKEELSHINLGEAFRHLPFPHRAATWRRSAVTGSRRAPYFISTEREGGNRVVTLHQDGGGARHWSVPAQSLPRTVLSAANAAESPTALAARREMQSWQLLRLEPSSLREPDDFRAPTSLGGDGAHLAATLHRLATATATATAARPLDAPGTGSAAPATAAPEQLYGALAARLSEVGDLGKLGDIGSEVGEIRVEADAKRELLTLMVTGRDGVAHAARSLSDGMLRLLALAVLAVDPRAPGLLCLEEPENGIHPARIPALLRLLQAIPTDVDEPLGAANPLRQVIVNTHSPAVVRGVPDDSLLVAEPQEASLAGQSARTVAFRALSGTWRAPRQQGVAAVTRAELLGPLHLEPHPPAGVRHRRAARPEDPQPLLPYSEPEPP